MSKTKLMYPIVYRDAWSQKLGAGICGFAGLALTAILGFSFNQVNLILIDNWLQLLAAICFFGVLIGLITTLFFGAVMFWHQQATITKDGITINDVNNGLSLKGVAIPWGQVAAIEWMTTMTGTNLPAVITKGGEAYLLPRIVWWLSTGTVILHEEYQDMIDTIKDTWKASPDYKPVKSITAQQSRVDSGTWMYMVVTAWMVVAISFNFMQSLPTTLTKTMFGVSLVGAVIITKLARRNQKQRLQKAGVPHIKLMADNGLEVSFSRVTMVTVIGLMLLIAFGLWAHYLATGSFSY
jgi:hypothetical protein